MDALEQLRQMEPQPFDSISAFHLKEKGNRAYAAKNMPKAAQKYTEAIAICTDEPTLASLYMNRSQVYLHLKMPADALADLQNTCVDQTNPKVVARAAQALMQLNRYSEAADLLASVGEEDRQRFPAITSLEQMAQRKAGAH